MTNDTRFYMRFFLYLLYLFKLSRENSLTFHFHERLKVYLIITYRFEFKRDFGNALFVRSNDVVIYNLI